MNVSDLNPNPYTAHDNFVYQNNKVLATLANNTDARTVAGLLNNAFLDGQQRIIDKMAANLKATGTIGGAA